MGERGEERREDGDDVGRVRGKGEQVGQVEEVEEGDDLVIEAVVEEGGDVGFGWEEPVWEE
jgi:hypothetical protein